ncbi:MAG: hypothetical protein GY796_20275, partial [Chloroflexi bacterium]|nr:hypothetical protein [Chloroflexota bacterium]
TGTAADWQPLEFPTPGEISLEGECTASLNPVELETLLPIGAVQGAADNSSRINETVSFRGIVTGSYEDRNARGIIFYTLFVQDLPGSEDGDPATSDGIAIFLGRERPSAQIGDQVRVSGQVTEFYGFTEIDDNGLEILVEESDRLLPDPIPINPPADNADQAAYFEPLEAMRVTIGGEAQVIGPTFSGCSFAVVGPDVTAAPILRQTIEDPVGQIIPILHNSDVDCAGFPNVKSGDMVTGLVGPLSYNFNQFKLVQQFPEDLDITAATLTPIPIPSKLNDNQISIATFNVENHFDNIDDTGDDAEPKPSAAEISLKQSKIAYQIHNVLGCPTLIGIQEVENETLLLQLTAELTEPCSFTYEVSHQESADGRGIDVALLSNPNDAVVQDAVLQQTCTQIQTGISDDNIDCPPGQDPLFSRPPLQVDLEIGGRPFTIFINHLKSKRGGERETAPRRLLQALHLNDQVTELLAADPEAAVVVLGDFNDYELSPAMLEMTENGRLHNTLSSIPLPQRYSFIFSGAAQLLDGILVSPALVESVASVAIHHVNADYPDSLTADAASPYKATDHDLPIIILNLQTEPEATAVPTLTAVPSPTSTPIPPSSPSTEPSGFNMLWLLGLGGLLIGGTAVYFLRRR